MGTFLIILAVGALCIGCFLIGARVGQSVSNGEKVEMPNVNPFEAYKKHEAKREAEKEMDKLETILNNIERYDGTGTGQKDIR